MEEEIMYLEFKLEKTTFEWQRQISSDSSEDKITADSGSVEMGKAIKQVEQELFSKKQKLQKIIDLVSKFEGVENKILKMKYRDGMTLPAIANELHYNPDYINHKHAEIMRRIRFADVGISV
ncbi:sigma-70 family RNA polymerase sigma factor [Bacillus cereus]|uniref:sigma-70 family RNA polymerase sigma factor n=1 Tax=Bacillus cereus TaxID=1396 RepID=UPI003D185862